MARVINLSQNKTTIVCECHYDLVSSRKWHYKADGMSGYAVSTEYLSGGRANKKNFIHKMHRIIAGAEPGQIADHINRDKLDNRCSNLRVVSIQENIINRDKQANNTSGYPGVQYRKARNKWIAIIGRDYKYTRLGSFNCPEEAYGAYLTAQECL